MASKAFILVTWMEGTSCLDFGRLSLPICAALICLGVESSCFSWFAFALGMRRRQRAGKTLHLSYRKMAETMGLAAWSPSDSAEQPRSRQLFQSTCGIGGAWGGPAPSGVARGTMACCLWSLGAQRGLSRVSQDSVAVV